MARGKDGRFVSSSQDGPDPVKVGSASSAQSLRVAQKKSRARRVVPPKAKFGIKSAGAGALFGLLASGLFGGGDKTPEGLPPELQMRLAAALQGQQAGADSGKQTTKTLQDIARLLAVLKGARDLAGVVTPPPFAPSQSNNPFGASGLVT